MLTITTEAAVLITSLVRDSDLPASAGLRLGRDPFVGSLQMRLSPRPDHDDVVMDHDGAQVFLAPVVAEVLDEQTLQAQLEDRPAFFLTT